MDDRPRTDRGGPRPGEVAAAELDPLPLETRGPVGDPHEERVTGAAHHRW